MAIVIQVAQIIVESTRCPPNWKIYNEHLLRQGKIDFYIEALGTWEVDFVTTNTSKVIHPFRYSDALFFVAWILRFLLLLPYRAQLASCGCLERRLTSQLCCYQTYRRCKQSDLRKWLLQHQLDGGLWSPLSPPA
ncbi:MAG: hypothetical protein RBG13Loki_4109 [Promethearchaeota archaeon CR_4]|nr:MAG: hypothetical protein RBG13Loki_4109 [Candidatus Lokiarchaeota archaeon CR_4]